MFTPGKLLSSPSLKVEYSTSFENIPWPGKMKYLVIILRKKLTWNPQLKKPSTKPDYLSGLSEGYTAKYGDQSLTDLLDLPNCAKTLDNLRLHRLMRQGASTDDQS